MLAWTVDEDCSSNGAPERGRPDVVLFVQAALGLPFQTRYKSEGTWWRASPYEVAEALSGYHGDLLDCLADLCDGQEVSSGLALFRIARITQEP